jgi:hypothetical protein
VLVASLYLLLLCLSSISILKATAGRARPIKAHIIRMDHQSTDKFLRVGRAFVFAVGKRVPLARRVMEIRNLKGHPRLGTRENNRRFLPDEESLRYG